MKVASVARTATVAWGPSSEHSNLLAAGTVAGAMSETFDSTAQLEVFKVDTQAGEMAPLGSVQINERFHRLAWGTKGMENGSMPYGILAGGMVDGTIKVFSPAKMVAGDGGDPIVASVDRHQGAVRGLEFNPSVPNLLASGAGESEVYITDLSNPAAPSVYSPGAKSNAPPSDISCVAWNRKVQHILASTSHNGLSVVWDLKLKKPVISFQDPSNKTCPHSVIAWNPEAATEVLVASEDDRSPVVQIWDLRNAMMPVRELHGHQKGILSASWCPNDSNLLLTSSKDSRTICWDPNTAEMLCELPATSRWTFDVQWSPKIPAILSSCSFDGTVAVYALSDASSVPSAANDLGYGGQQQPARVGRAPKWLKRPCGATFGFGGQLALFNGPSAAIVSRVDVVSDAQVVARSQQLEAALEQGADGLGAFCGAKAAAPAASARDAAEWRLMQVLCSAEQRRLLLGFLGLAEEEEPAAAAPTPQTPGGAPPPVAPPGADDDPAALFSAMAVATEAAAEQEAMTPPTSAPPPAPSYDATPVVQTLGALQQKCNAFNLPPMDKRKMEDVAKRMAGLEAKLGTGEISPSVFGNLTQLCQALAGGDVQTALNVHVAITTSDWADNGQWLMGLKRLIEMVAKLQVRL